MGRLHEVGRDEVDSPLVTSCYDMLFGDRDPVTEPGTETGTRGDWWTVMANSPDVLKHAVRGFSLYGSAERRLDPVLRELSQTRTGWTAQSQFVFSQHCKSLRGLDVSEERIAAIGHWQIATCFSDVERLVLAYADCLVYDHGRVPDELFDSLRDQLGDEGLLELTYICAMYLQHAVVSRALRLEFDDVDERVVEVPAPEDAPAGLRIALDDADQA